MYTAVIANFCGSMIERRKNTRIARCTKIVASMIVSNKTVLVS